MKNINKSYENYYPSFIGSALILIVLSFSLITRGDKLRDDFIHKNGKISYLAQSFPSKSSTKVRPKKVYLKLDNFERVFELFIGTDKGDFSPKVNRLNELALGDEVDVYFEENNKTRRDHVNRLVQFLDKDGELFYLRSKVDKYIGYLMLGSSAVLLMIVAYMKVKSR